MPPSRVSPEPAFQKQRRPGMRSGLAHQAPDVGGKGPRSSGGGVHTLGAQRPGPLGGDGMAAPSRGGVCAEQTGHRLRAQSQADAVGTRLQPREATAARSCPGAGRAGGLRASLGARVGPSCPKGRQLPQTRTCQPSRKGGEQSGPSQERSWGRRGGPRIKPSLTARRGLEAARAGLFSLAWSY